MAMVVKGAIAIGKRVIRAFPNVSMVKMSDRPISLTLSNSSHRACLASTAEMPVALPVFLGDGIPELG